MKEFIFTWRIENISYSWHKTGESLISPSFNAGPIQNSVWALELYPRGKILPDYLSLYLRRLYDNGPVNLNINFDFSCISSENSELHSDICAEADTSFTNNGAGFGPPRFMRHHEVFILKKDLYLPRDALTLRCRMWKNEGTGNEFGQSFGHTRLPIERILSIENMNCEIAKENTVYINSKLRNKLLISISMLHCEDSTRLVINKTNDENINMKFSVLKLLFMQKTIRKKIICERTCTWLGAPRSEILRLPVLCKALHTEDEISMENNVELQIEFVYTVGEETKQIDDDNPYSSRLAEHVSKYINSCISSGNLSDLPRVSQDLWNLYEEHVLCDVELRTPTTSFFAHKLVLCARSPVFLVMLTGDMKEKRNECIEIEDIADDILGKFLLFLYTDTFEDFEWDVVIGLYYASDKYQIERLKILCCSYLLKNADVDDNVPELLMLADRHQDSDFKSRVDDFISQNNEKILSYLAWQEYVDEQPSQPAKAMVLRHDKEREKENGVESYNKKLSRLPNVLDDFTAAYQGEIISDIVIKTTNSTFNAHRCVLCAGSCRMREKFTKDFKDEKSNILEIPDLEDDTVSGVLLFLYTNSLGDVKWDTAIKLYHAADVYQIPRLKVKCSCFLLENLETCNASDLLLLAHEYQDARLKSIVQDYIILHDEEIFASDEWADFSETNSRLANETMRLKYKKN